MGESTMSKSRVELADLTDLVKLVAAQLAPDEHLKKCFEITLYCFVVPA